MLRSKHNQYLLLRPSLTHVKNFSWSSLNFQSKPETIENDEIFDKLKSINREFVKENISTKFVQKLPARPPFVKNFFIGQVNTELVPYPEVIIREDLNKLNKETVQLNEFFMTKIAPIADSTGFENILLNLQQHNILGINIPQYLGGKEYNFSESLIASTIETTNIGLAVVLASHRTVVDVLNELCTDEQKKRFLPTFANGTETATTAIFEENLPETSYFNTIAEYDSASKFWTLNGSKCNVINGIYANKLLVLAQTKMLDISGDVKEGVSCFLIDSSLPGIKISGPIKMHGINKANISNITFANVLIPEENLIGVANEATDLVQSLSRSSRLRLSHISIEMMKKIVEYYTSYSIQNKYCGVPLMEMGLVKQNLSQMVCLTYAAESLLYYTAGLIDEFDKQDVEMEAAITKIFAISNLRILAENLITLLGPKSLESGESAEIYLRDSAQLIALGETLDSLRLSVGMLGLQHLGKYASENVKKLRNPLFNSMDIFRQIMTSDSIETPKIRSYLCEHLHPSLKISSDFLEESIKRLKMAAEIMLIKHGANVVKEQINITRLTDCVVLAFATFASLSRASRSYCIGLSNSSFEVLLASTMATFARDQIKTTTIEISNGPYITNDDNHFKLTKLICKSGGYFPENPLKYNY